MKKGKQVHRNRKMLRNLLLTHTCVVVLLGGLLFSMGVVGAADPSLVRVNPATQSISAGSSFTISIDCVPGQPVKAFELKLSFTPSLVRVNSVTEGDFFTGYTTFFSPGVIDNGAGTIINVYNLVVGPGNVSDSGSLIVINLTARSTSGTSPLNLYEVRLTNESGYLPVSIVSGSITVTGGSSPPPPPPGGGGGDTPPVSNTPPSQPSKPVGPTFAEAGTMYSYSAAAVDPDGDLVRLRFDWGDETLSEWSALVASNSSVSLSHAWDNVSTYPVRVIAQDASGANSSWSEALNVTISQLGPEGVPPVGVIRLPMNASTNQTLIFDASESYDPDGSIVSYRWDFGDGTTELGAVITHTYQYPGDYTVVLTVTDNAGLSSSVSQVVQVTYGADVSGENGLVFADQTTLLLILGGVVVSVLIVLLVYRYRKQPAALLKQIEQDKRRIAQLRAKNASLKKQSKQSTRYPVPLTAAALDINQIVDGLFAQIQQRRETPRTETLLDAYNDFIMSLVEKNPKSALPQLNITAVEELVERRMHALVAEKVDKL